MQLPLGLGDLDFGDWLYSLLAAFIGGGASAVTSGVVVSLKDPEHYNFQSAAFYELVAAVFVASGLMNAMAFLRQKPLPSFKVIEKTTARTVTAGEPPVVTTSITETTKVPVPPAEGKP